MNKILTGALLLLFSSSAAAQTPRDSIAFATAQWRTADLGGGAECRYAQIDMFGSRQSISVATYPGRRFTTSIVHLDRRAESTSRSGEGRRRGDRRQRQLLQRQNLRTGHLRPARQEDRGTHHPRGGIPHQRRHRLQGPQGPPDGDLPVRHDAVCRRGAPLPLGAGRRPGADRRRQGGRIRPPGAVSTRAAIPGR